MKKFILCFILILISIKSYAAVVTHGGTLPDSSQKSDFYALIDSATITGIVNADVSSSAAIVASKLDLSSPGTIGNTTPNSGKFTTLVTTGNVGISSVNPGQVLDVGGTVRSSGFNVNGYQGISGAWASKSVSTVYLATTDGILTGVASVSNTNSGTVECLTDGSNPPTTIRSENGVYPSNGAGAVCSCTTPVRKNDYYEVIPSNGNVSVSAVYFIPVGS